METLSFSYNWNNKLDNKCYTTIRLKSPKYIVGKQFTVMLKDEPKGLVYVRDIIEFKIANISEYVSCLDMGYTKEKGIETIKTMYKNKNINWENQVLLLILCVKM